MVLRVCWQISLEVVEHSLVHLWDSKQVTNIT